MLLKFIMVMLAQIMLFTYMYRERNLESIDPTATKVGS
jgi:hypothetical protein